MFKHLILKILSHAVKESTVWSARKGWCALLLHHVDDLLQCSQKKYRQTRIETGKMEI
jgi:hypothetical protein